MKITPRGLNRSTLGRQMLLRREPLDASEGVRRAVALQAQQPASPYIALWNRVSDFDPADLDAAYADGTIVRSNMVRITLHATHIDDYPAFREASDPTLRAARLRDRRFKVTGLTEADADALVPELQAFAGEPRTTEEMQSWLDERRDVPPHKGVWWGMRQYTPLLHAPTGEAWSFGRRRSYVAPPTRPTLADPAVADKSLQTLILRYLEGFGPASVPDVALFAMVKRTQVRKALQALGDDLLWLEGPDGEELFDIPGGLFPDEDTPASPRLLGMWDNILLSYFVRDRIIPPDYRKLVIQRNGDVLPTLLVDGYVAGIWRAVEGGVEATAFHPLSDDVWERLASEARSLTELLAGRDPEVYSSYNHWWDKLSVGDARLLPAD